MSDERNVGHWRKDTDPIKRAIAAVVAYSWVHTGACEELQDLSEELRALIGIKERLAAVEAERDELELVNRSFRGDAEIVALRAVAEAAGDIDPPTTWSGRHHECRTCGMFADVEDAIMHTARCPYGRLQSALQRWKEVTW